MRLPEGAEVHWGRITALVVYLIAIVVLAFVVPAVGWMLIALTVLTAGVLLTPKSNRRSRRRAGKLDEPPAPSDDGTPRGGFL